MGLGDLQNLTVLAVAQLGDDAVARNVRELLAETVGRDVAVPTIFVTLDVNLRIRADALGLTTEIYENQAVDVEHMETGTAELDLPGEAAGAACSR